MPEVDPAAINAAQWGEIGTWMHWLWAYFFCIVILALNFLTAHAVIPSLVSSGHLPQKFLKMRLPLYLGTVAFLGLAMLFLTWTVNNSRLLENVYNRFFI